MYFVHVYHRVQGAAKEFRFPQAEFRKQLKSVQEEAAKKYQEESYAVGQRQTKLCGQLQLLAKIL
jgi:hypothetical protein